LCVLDHPTSFQGRFKIIRALNGPENYNCRRRFNPKVLIVAHQPDASAASLQGFIQETIEPGSIIHTDGWTGYSNLENKGYGHKVIVLLNNKKSASDLLPHVHRIASLLKRWLMGTHQGAISHEHLDYYLDEYVFRFNRRTSQYRGKLFYRMIQQAVQTPPVTFKGIRQNVRGLGHGKRTR
jgi:transposase-like protein